MGIRGGEAGGIWGGAGKKNWRKGAWVKKDHFRYRRCVFALVSIICSFIYNRVFCIEGVCSLW